MKEMKPQCKADRFAAWKHSSTAQRAPLPARAEQEGRPGAWHGYKASSDGRAMERRSKEISGPSVATSAQP
jgi:hypothetical protein